MELFDILGRAVMRLSAPYSQVFGQGVFSIVTGFDINQLERGNVEADHLVNEITVLADGFYDVTVQVSAEFASGDELQMMIFINDAQLSANPVGIQGRGTGRPVYFAWTFLHQFVAGDVMDLRMQNGESGNLNCLLKRLYLDVKADS